MDGLEQPRLLPTLNVYADDLRVGDRIHSARARTITECDLVTFSAFSGDWSSLHTDAEWCAVHSPFGGRIAQGFLTLSVATGLEFTIFGSSQDKVLAFYGMDRVRFVRPVSIGDTIHVEGTIGAIEDKDNTRSVIVIRQEIKNQLDETVVALDKRMLIKKRSYDQVPNEVSPA
jgi:acyl dehydratase